MVDGMNEYEVVFSGHGAGAGGGSGGVGLKCWLKMSTYNRGAELDNTCPC